MNENEEITNLEDFLSDEEQLSAQDESSSQPISVTDAPQTADDVVKAKRQYSSGDMDIKGNQAENQQFIQTAIFYGGNNFGIREMTGNASSGADPNVKEYDLSKAGEFAAFGENYGASEYFVYAIILSVFEYTELDDLQNLKSKLLEELPPITDVEGKTVVPRQNPYLPISGVLRIIKGKQFTTQSGEHCVGFGDNRSAALSSLWGQFPTLRENIVRWLITVSDAFEYRTNFDAFQVSSAFYNVIKLDFTAGMRHIFPRLYSKPEKYWLLGHIALALHNDESCHDKILPFIEDWVLSGSNWLWKSALYVYAYIKEQGRDNGFDEKMRQNMEHRFAMLTSSDRRYVGLLMAYSERLRTLTARILNDLIVKTREYNEKIALALAYVEFLRYGYYSVSEENPVCPLLTCDTKAQLMSVQPLITAILPRYQTRHVFFSIIEAYLKEISNYAIDEKTEKHVKAYFSVMAENNPHHVGDILLFLRKCDCSVADVLISIIKTKSNS